MEMIMGKNKSVKRIIKAARVALIYMSDLTEGGTNGRKEECRAYAELDESLSGIKVKIIYFPFCNSCGTASIGASSGDICGCEKGTIEIRQFVSV